MNIGEHLQIIAIVVWSPDNDITIC